MRILIFATMVAALTATLPGTSRAGSKDDVFAACAARMTAEFGEAEFSFGKIRRSGNRNLAFGELTLADGSKRRIRCEVKRGKVRDVLFRNGNQSQLNGGFWEKARPAGAVFVPPEEANPTDPEQPSQDIAAPEEDQATQTADSDNTDTDTAQPDAPKRTGPVFKSVN